MADKQITDLPVATELNDADLLLTRQGSTDKQVTKEVAFAQHLKGSENLADVPNKATARTNLDVPQIGATVLRANNLSDLANAGAARANLGVTIGSHVQAWSAQLDAVAANNTVAGLVAQTGTNTVASRTLVATSSKIAIVNGTGAAGNPGIDVQEANINMNNTGTVLGVPKGGSGVDTVNAYGLIIGGTTSTAPFQSVSPASNTNKIVYSTSPTAPPGWVYNHAGILAAKSYSGTSTAAEYVLNNIPVSPFGSGALTYYLRFVLQMPASEKLCLYFGSQEALDGSITYGTSYRWRDVINGTATTSSSDSKLVIYDSTVNTSDWLVGNLWLTKFGQSFYGGGFVKRFYNGNTAPDSCEITIAATTSLSATAAYYAFKLASSSGGNMTNPSIRAYMDNNRFNTW